MRIIWNTLIFVTLFDKWHEMNYIKIDRKNIALIHNFMIRIEIYPIQDYYKPSENRKAHSLLHVRFPVEYKWINERQGQFLFKYL